MGLSLLMIVALIVLLAGMVWHARRNPKGVDPSYEKTFGEGLRRTRGMPYIPPPPGCNYDHPGRP